MFTLIATSALCMNTHTHTHVNVHRTAPNCDVTTQRTSSHFRQGWWLSCCEIRQNVHRKRRCKYIHNFGTDKRTEGPVGDLFRTCQGYDLLEMCKLPDTTSKMAVPTLTTATGLCNNLRLLTSSLPQAYQQNFSVPHSRTAYSQSSRLIQFSPLYCSV
jgi:hypothetical protein